MCKVQSCPVSPIVEDYAARVSPVHQIRRLISIILSKYNQLIPKTLIRVYIRQLPTGEYITWFASNDGLLAQIAFTTERILQGRAELFWVFAQAQAISPKITEN